MHGTGQRPSRSGCSYDLAGTGCSDEQFIPCRALVPSPSVCGNSALLSTLTNGKLQGGRARRMADVALGGVPSRPLLSWSTQDGLGAPPWSSTAAIFSLLGFQVVAEGPPQAVQGSLGGG